MAPQLFMKHIKAKTVGDLKELITLRGWSIEGLRLKADYQKYIINQSYKEVQMVGIEQMKALV